MDKWLIQQVTEGGPPASVRRRVFSPAARFSLRLRERSASQISRVAGFSVSMELNRFTADAMRLSARIGVDEWLLIISQPADGSVIAQELNTSLAPHFHSLVDVTDRQCGLILQGPCAPEVLMSGCPLDLRHAGFGIGSATRTVLGRVEITLMRTTVYSYLIECGRSFGAYVDAFLDNAAREYEPD